MTTERIACDECGRRVNEFHASTCSAVALSAEAQEVRQDLAGRIWHLPDEPEILGYTVVAERPGRTDPAEVRREVVGSLWPDRDPAENHQAYCELAAPGGLDAFGKPVTYRVAEIRVAT